MTRMTPNAISSTPSAPALRIEAALDAAVVRASTGDAPPQLASALRYAVFPGGARVRPKLCLAVAQACGDDQPAITEAAAAAIEFLHCASLVHDDLPCFDAAPTRRGKPSLHVTFGEPLAVLAGDALIVLAFDGLARAGARAPRRLAGLLSALVRGVGLPSGIVAGQAWESEPFTPVESYHRAKTGALFVAACAAGALAAGAEPTPWRLVGEHLGGAYQIADDLLDALSAPEDCGKPTGRDIALQRPSLVRDLGVRGAYERLKSCIESAVSAIPACDGAKGLADLVRAQAMRLTPQQLARSAA